MGDRGIAIDASHDILDSRASVIPAWGNLKRIVYNDEGVNRYASGAIALSKLHDRMWPSEPGVGRFGLPSDFGPLDSQVDLPEDPQWMIFDEDYCSMPDGIARRIAHSNSASALKYMEYASRTLCTHLRHGGRGRVQPFNEGGWFKCRDIIRLTGKQDLPILLRNIKFLYTAVCENDKRFQLAVLTTDTGDDRREVVQ
eukprot:16441684-Heterocapsa_arctica.AAC.1